MVSDWMYTKTALGCLRRYGRGDERERGRLGRRDPGRCGAPGYAPADAPFRVRRAPPERLDALNTGLVSFLTTFAYLDRIGPDAFVGRYDWGRCGAPMPKYAGRDPKKWYRHFEAAPPNALGMHAYVATITPDSVRCVCLYCGGELDGCPVADTDRIPWDQPYDGPRRATPLELRSAGIPYIPEHRLLYLDEVDSMVCTGRYRSGACPRGGPHEAVMWWWNARRDARQSACAFCGSQWNGSPPGFWEHQEPHLTVEGTLREHDEAVRRGRY